jgi:multiple sugar transport system permease protein
MNRRRYGVLASKEAIQGFLYILPWLFGSFVFYFGPMIASLVISLTRYNIINPPVFHGLKNYVDMVHDKFFWKSLKVTAYYAALSVPLGLAGSLSLAILVNRPVAGRSLYRTTLYLPSVTPAVAASTIWLWFLQPRFGLLNAIIGIFGIKGPAWLASREWAVPALVLVSLWRIGGPQMLIFLAGLQGIPQEELEAASIDGANTWQRFIRIKVPHLTPTIFFNLIIGVIANFRVFTEAYIITEGGPDNSTLFYVLYLYRNAFNYYRMGYATALAWVLLLIVLTLTVIQTQGGKRWVYYGG